MTSSKVIRTIEDLAEYLGITVDDLERAIYKYTACGAWITWSSTAVTVGTIVEGSDAEFSRVLPFPFTGEDFDDSILELEDLADEAWHEANDDPEDWQ